MPTPNLHRHLYVVDDDRSMKEVRTKNLQLSFEEKGVLNVQASKFKTTNLSKLK
jgi:hypothetical protein